MKLTRRGFLASGAAAATVQAAPRIGAGLGKSGGRRVLTLVYDKALGAMRAVDRLVP